jgi:hypothetical protein
MHFYVTYGSRFQPLSRKQGVAHPQPSTTHGTARMLRIMLRSMHRVCCAACNVHDEARMLPDALCCDACIAHHA